MQSATYKPAPSYASPIQIYVKQDWDGNIVDRTPPAHTRISELEQRIKELEKRVSESLKEKPADTN